MAWRISLDRVLAEKLRVALTSHSRPPVSRSEFAQWVWPTIKWDETLRLEAAIRMTQDYVEELEGCVSYSPRHGGYIWVDSSSDQFTSIAQRSVLKGVSRVILGVGTMLMSSAAIIRMLGNKLPPRLRRTLHEKADLFEYTGKAAKSAVEDLKDIA